MTVEPDEVLVFDRRHLDPVVALMRPLAAARDGWLVVDPGVDVEDLVPPSNLLGLFTGRGSDVPQCSWVPGERRRGRPTPLSVGVQHGAGRRARPALVEHGIHVPAGWTVVSDHPKRGLVLQVPDEAPHAEVLGWLLQAASALSRVPLDDEWRASVYRR